MLEYLILSNRIEAACKYNVISPKNFQQELFQHFDKGNREHFFRLYQLLKEETKLQFYLRVYFLIYDIHPNAKAKSAISEQQLIAFKNYLNNKGAELAKTNQFLQFYALPYIKKHTQHPKYQAIFKKEWINNLRAKLKIYVQNQLERIKKEANSLMGKKEKNSNISYSAEDEKIQQMQRINKQLFEEVRQFDEKYQQLEFNHKSMIQSFNSHMLESQSKWFQITKQLVSCSKNLIQMIVQKHSELINERKFIKIRKRTQKYQRFVNKKLDDLLNQSQDLSIFDRPSANQLSTFTVTPYTQKNITTFFPIEQYIPTNFQVLKNNFPRLKQSQKKLIIQGLTWRIIKSRDNLVRKQNIAGIFLNDFLNIQNGKINELITSRQLMRTTLELLYCISLDNYGRRKMFANKLIHKDLVAILTQATDDICVGYVFATLQQLTYQGNLDEELISLGLIKIGLEYLAEQWVSNNENILENILTCLLHLGRHKKGLEQFQKEPIQVFQMIAEFLRTHYPSLTRVVANGVLITLAQKSQKIFRKISESNVKYIIQQIIQNQQDANVDQLMMLADRLKTFKSDGFEDQIQEQYQEQHSISFAEAPEDLEQMLAGHQYLIQKYLLSGRQAIKQTEQIKLTLNDFSRKRQIQIQVAKQKKRKQLQNQRNYKEPQKRPSQIQQKNKSIVNEKVKKSSNTQFKSPRQAKREKQIHNHQSRQQPLKNKQQYRIRKLSQQKISKQQPQNKNIAKKKQQRQQKSKEKQRPSTKHETRLQMSEAVERDIRTSYQRQRQYQTHMNEKITEFYPADQRFMKSPQPKKSREEVLRQLNEELKAKKKKKEEKKNITVREYNVRQNLQLKDKKQVEQYQRGFNSKPKLKRTPPKQSQN